jgi:hypothetical protein
MRIILHNKYFAFDVENTLNNEWRTKQKRILIKLRVSDTRIQWNLDSVKCQEPGNRMKKS